MIQHGIYLTWNDLSADVKGKKILNNVSGYCTPGSTLAIMGPSGAGKTTMLSILAKKYGNNVNISGTVHANNTPYSEAEFYNFASFVYQNDILNEALTVRQTLQFTARLKLADQQKADERVDELIRDFSLQKCQNVYVGGKFIKGISGGEKKRVCIAVEVVNKPDLLILDEPTSGLDSYMANNILKIFNKLAKEGRTIIFTIHQPSYKIFTQLDRLLLLDKGECIYQGLASGITEYMMSLNISIPTNTTICDYFMFEISAYKENLKNEKTKLNSIAYNQNLHSKIQKQMKQFDQISPDGYQLVKIVQNFYHQFLILMSRQINLFRRTPIKLARSIGNSIFMIAVIGLTFMNVISNNRPSPDKVYSYFQLIQYFIGAQGPSFIISTMITMTGILTVALVFPTQRQVYAKQTASKTYSTFCYFISKVIVQLAIMFLAVIIFCSGSYWLIGFTHEFIKFVKLISVLSCMAIVGNSIGFWTGALFKQTRKASSMAPVLLMPMIMFSGLFNKLDSIPNWISWIQYLSPFRYSLHAVLLNQFNDQKYLMYNGQYFDYKQDLAIDLTFQLNILCIIGTAIFYYILAFIFLKKISAKLSA